MGEQTSGEPAATQPGWDRLEQQLAWYGRKSRANKRAYEYLKVIELLVAAAIPVTAGAGAGATPAAILGALIVVMEGLQSLFQFQQNWTAYRSTCEALKHEKYLFLARASQYANVVRPEALLAERVEGLVSQEHAAWTSEHHELIRKAGVAA